MEVLVIPANLSDHTATVRAVQPYKALERLWPEFKIANSMFSANAMAICSNTMCTVDAVFLQRPCTKEHIEIARMTKECGVPLLIDYDDFIWDIPDSNLAKETYEHQGWLPLAAQCVLMADAITVTTRSLATAISAKFKVDPVKIRVIPNAWDDVFVWPKEQLNPPRPSKICAYRGSNTHPADYALLGDTVVELSNKHPDWKWYFFGYTHGSAKKIPEPRRVSRGFTDLYVYLNELRRTAPDFMYFPLTDELFNHCKAQMAQYEAAWVGAPLICPDWEDWSIPGAITYAPGKCAEALDAAMSGEIDLASRAKESWAWIMDNRRLSRVNLMRKNLLQELVSSRR